MLPANWHRWCQIRYARLMIRCGWLTHSSFSQHELQTLLDAQLPSNFALKVPNGQGTLSLLQGEVSLHQQEIQCRFFASLQITYMGNPIYRAHLHIKVRCLPQYCQATQRVNLASLHLDELALLQDEYALLKDTASLIRQLVPNPLNGLFSGGVKAALSLLPAKGLGQQALQYLQLYLDGSKQKVLDYHQPQIHQQLQSLVNSENASYQLNKDDWQEALFIEHGRKVEIKDHTLRFCF